MKKAEAEKRRKALAAAQEAAKRKRLLKLRQDPGAQGREGKSQRPARPVGQASNKMKVVPRRCSTATARLVNRRIMSFR